MKINMKNKINEVLDFIVNELSTNKLNLPSPVDGEKTDLIEDKKILMQFLLTNKNIASTLDQYGLKMVEAQADQEFDLSIESENEFYPISINPTILRWKENDNLNCKWGIYYALTGQKPNLIDEEMNWNKFLNLLKNNAKENDQDYYFLVINRENSTEVFWNSLKQISLLVTNGQNLPFKCCWNKNKSRVNRNFEEAKKFLMTNLRKSIKIRNQIMKKFRMNTRWAAKITKT